QPHHGVEAIAGRLVVAGSSVL
ncbi:MAG: hypothetical protein Q605_AUC00900G0002, partial [Actinomyces urogenitalis DORA_12]